MRKFNKMYFLNLYVTLQTVEMFIFKMSEQQQQQLLRQPKQNNDEKKRRSMLFTDTSEAYLLTAKNEFLNATKIL